ncbi:MAG: 4Fe-4S dicluster domain-containing protein [Leadbetterella sp.]
MISQLIFLGFLGIVGFLIWQRSKLLLQSIRLGKETTSTGSTMSRIKNICLMALGQKRMFDKPLVAILHLFVYVGFIVINIELLEIILDGVLGTHRILYSVLGDLYAPMIHIFEVLAFLVIFACIVFLIRRNIGKVNRLNPDRHRELKGWAAIDANTILVIEIVLMVAFLLMNASDTILQNRGIGHYVEVHTGEFLVSKHLIGLLTGFHDNTLIIIERACWWIHIVGIGIFSLYLFHSKHLHIIFAFPNTYFAQVESSAKITNMPAVSAEVSSMLGITASSNNATEIGRFGAKDVQDLSRKSLMDAFTCTECGRCTDQCPANKTGKLLSPRKIMMDTRDRLEDIQEGWKAKGSEFVDEKTLLGDYISKEELLACTSCQACVEACPVQINPLSIIIELRRYMIMEESHAPQSWNMMFQNLETSMSPWKFSSDQRADWAKE